MKRPNDDQLTSPRDELAQLLEASLRDEITDEQLQRLEQLVLNDPAARTRAAEYLAVSLSLREWAEASDLIADGLPLATSAVVDEGHASVMQKVEAEILRRPRLLSVAVAALVMGILVTALALVAPPVYRAVQHSFAANETAGPGFVASLAGTFEAEWAEGQIGTQRGSQLGPGHRMMLMSGYVEVEFQSGARLVVEGPASLTIADAKQATLLRGKLVARVPPSAHGFTVTTTQGRIVDLGTEFAVDADPLGDVEVHVIEGRVELRNVKGESLAMNEVLTAGNSAKFRRDAGQTVVTPIAYQIDGFTRRSPTSDADWTADTPLPVGRALSLWLSADFGVVHDSQGRVAIWKDRLTGDNRRAENAVQIEAARRPRPIADGIGGQPALVFDGRATNLITSPRAASGEQTIFLVAAPQRLRGRPGMQLLNTGSSPNYVVDISPDGEVIARSYDGKRNLPMLTNGVVELRAPLLITFTHSQSDHRAQLWVNGQSQSINSASQATFGIGKLLLGSHGTFVSFFEGQIAEVIIFDDALTDNELTLVTQYLGNKYSIAF